MKKIVTLGYAVLCPLLLSAQVNLINTGGAAMRVTTGVNVKVNNGAITNKNNATITNNGNIYLDRDFTQNTGAAYSGGTVSWLWFEGGADQDIGGDAPIDITQLRADNGNLVVLNTDVYVSQTVDLMNNGSIELGTNDLIVAPGGVVTNYDANHYIITNSTGVLQQQVGGANVVFPVGNSAYNPATIQNTGTVDNFRTRVEDVVYDHGVSGTPETVDVVNRTWHIDEETAGGSVANITVQWNTSEELSGFDRNASAVSHWDGVWDHSMTYTPATSVGAALWTQTRSGQTTFSPFAVEDTEVELPVELITFDAKRRDVAHVDLNWATASETNNRGFELERMLDHETAFTKIGWVDGNGTTANTSHYDWMDVNGHQSVSYYRLKQVDFDGTVTYSNIKAVAGIKGTLGADISVYPNPVSDQLSIRFEGLPTDVKTARFQIINISGQILYDVEQSINPQQIYTIDYVKELVPAMYTLSIETNQGDQIVQKFIVTRP